MNARTLLAIGTGIGVQIAGQDLRITVARVRPGGIKLLGATVIEAFRQRPASEWGAEYAAFLRRLGAGHLAATVLLPRSEVIVRQVALAGVADRDFASAIQFQIDSLHPYGEDEAQYAWARLPHSPVALIGIAAKPLIERYSQMFLEAGIKIAAFTFSAAVLYSALRVLSTPPPEGFLTIIDGRAELEVYGESPSRPIFSALLDASPEAASSLAAAELRLPPDTQPAPLQEILPQPKSSPAGALDYATALAGACPRLGLNVNLLPRELRSTNSRIIFVPTVALAAALLLLVVALAAQAGLEKRRRLALLHSEIARFEPSAIKAEAAQRLARATQTRIELFDGFRRRVPADLDVLNELTGLLAPPAWVNNLDMTRDSVVVSGQIEQAAPLLKQLDASPQFKNSEFMGPLGKAGKNDVFRVRSLRREVAP